MVPGDGVDIYIYLYMCILYNALFNLISFTPKYITCSVYLHNIWISKPQYRLRIPL